MTRTTPAAVAEGAMRDSVQPRLTVDAELDLRPWRLLDAPAVLAAFSDDDIIKWHTRRIHSIDEAEEWITAAQEAWTKELSSGWAIVDRADEAVLGRCAMHTHLDEGIAEIAYWVLPNARRRGIAARAAVAATRWAHEFGFHRVELEHSTHNLASRSVAQRAGFIPEGIKRQSARHADGPHDMQLHAHLSTDPLPTLAAAVND